MEWEKYCRQCGEEMTEPIEGLTLPLFKDICAECLEAETKD